VLIHDLNRVNRAHDLSCFLFSFPLAFPFHLNAHLFSVTLELNSILNVIIVLRLNHKYCAIGTRANQAKDVLEYLVDCILSET
jgi:hypothetical protein